MDGLKRNGVRRSLIAMQHKLMFLIGTIEDADPDSDLHHALGNVNVCLSEAVEHAGGYGKRFEVMDARKESLR